MNLLSVYWQGSRRNRTIYKTQDQPVMEDSNLNMEHNNKASKYADTIN